MNEKTPRISAGCLFEKRLCRLLRSVASHVNEKLLDPAQSSAEIFEFFLDGHRFDPWLFLLFVHSMFSWLIISTFDCGDQYSSGRRKVVADLSHSVITQNFSPFFV